MNKKSKRSTIVGIIILVLCIVLTIGVKVLFHACGMHDDGAYGSCHWAEQAIFAMGILLSVSALILLVINDVNTQTALSTVIGCGGIISAVIPQTFISLCMMPSMRCNAVMAPAVRGIGAVIAILCLINILMSIMQSKTIERN